jgi:hypothetical protein
MRASNFITGNVAWVVGRLLAAVAEWKSYGNAAAAHSLPDIEDCGVAYYTFCQYYQHSRKDSKPACPLCATSTTCRQCERNRVTSGDVCFCTFAFVPKNVNRNTRSAIKKPCNSAPFYLADIFCHFSQLLRCACELSSVRARLTQQKTRQLMATEGCQIK